VAVRGKYKKVFNGKHAFTAGQKKEYWFPLHDDIWTDGTNPLDHQVIFRLKFNNAKNMTLKTSIAGNSLKVIQIDKYNKMVSILRPIDGNRVDPGRNKVGVHLSAGQGSVDVLEIGFFYYTKP
jgi:hypothetical protein